MWSWVTVFSCFRFASLCLVIKHCDITPLLRLVTWLWLIGPGGKRVSEWSEVDDKQWMKGADGWRGTKGIKRNWDSSSESMSIHWLSSKRTTHTHIHTHHISFIYVSSSHGNFFCVDLVDSWTWHCLCVFQFVFQCQAGGNINDLYLWQHQRHSHQYTPISQTVQCLSLLWWCVCVLRV